MARTVTLAQLRADARLYADQRVHSSSGSTFVSDTELTRLINLQLAELHELLVSARGDDYDGRISEATSTLAPGVSRYDLPLDFFQLLSAELLWSEHDRELLRHISTNPDTTRYQNSGAWDRWALKGYRLRGAYIRIYPTPRSAVDLYLRYAPHFVDLAGDSDTYDGVNGWEKLVALGAAIELRTIEGRPLGSLQSLYDAQKARIEAMVDERQATDPIHIRDVEGDVVAPYGRHRWGFFA